MFQSTPAITGERARPSTTGQPPICCFNPRPPLLASEPKVAGYIMRRNLCFNPRPPLLASEPSRWGCDMGRAVVSIHARHYWRASRAGGLDGLGQALVSIHARHYWRASRAMKQPEDSRALVSIHARHYWRASPWTSATPMPARSSFNPRPPLLASEPQRQCH